MKDLTKGKPSRLILAFALPIFLANLLQLTYSLVDTRIVGTFLGEDALAAVGATSSLSNLIIGFLMGLSNGFAIITAQRFGAKDLRGVKKSFAMSLTLGIAVAAGLTVLGLLFLQPILRFLNVPENLRTMAGSYIVIIIAGLIATFLYDACAAALRALGDTITPLVILAISVILNIAGDLFFVVVLKTGVRGAAVATVSAQALAFVICWIYMIKRYELLRLSGDDFKEPQPQMIQSMLSAGLSMGFMSSLINIGSLTLQTAINKLGQNIIVAHTAARKISEMFMIMFTVFGQTMATYCGQNLGAGRIDRIKKGIHQAFVIVLVQGVIFTTFCWIFGHPLIRWITSSNDTYILDTAYRYLTRNTSFYFVLGPLFVLRCSLQGLEHKVIPVASSILELVLKIVSTIWIVPVLGYTGVIYTEPIIWTFMTLMLIGGYVRALKQINEAEHIKSARNAKAENEKINVDNRL